MSLSAPAERGAEGRQQDHLLPARERDDQKEWAEQWLADIAALYRWNDERLQVRGEPTQDAAPTRRCGRA